GLTTGYFGSLTRNALKRFQSKHNLLQTGEVDSDTKDLLEEYFKERSGSRFENGFLRLPNIFERVQHNICDRVRVASWSVFCKDFTHDHDDEDEDEDDDTEPTEFEVAIVVNDGETT